MDLKIFEEIYDRWKCKSPGEKFWSSELAEQYGASSSEGLRSDFRRARKAFSQVGSAKVLVFDVEVTPLIAYVWDIWNQNVAIDQIRTDSYFLSWSAKFLNEPEVYGDVLTSEEAVSCNDGRIIKSLSDLLNKSDILIGHNIIGYDEKMLNSRILFHGLLPIRKHFSIDTLLVAKSNFRFVSNKLKYINRYLGIKEKLDNSGMELWINCMAGDSDSLQSMYEYNQGDVLATEDLYYRLRPFIKGHPNLGLYFETNDEHCPNCGSIKLNSDGYYYTPAGRYQSLRCECGAVCRSKQNELDVAKRKSLKVN